MGSDSVSCPGHRHWSASSADRFPESCGRVARSIGALGASAGLGSDLVGICTRKCDVPLRQPVCPCSIFDARPVTIVALRSGPALSATKILWGQIVVVSVIVLAAIWGATQWTAWRLGYQPQLGTPWA